MSGKLVENSTARIVQKPVSVRLNRVGGWVVGGWVVGRGSWVVGCGSWAVGRGSWVVFV